MLRRLTPAHIREIAQQTVYCGNKPYAASNITYASKRTMSDDKSADKSAAADAKIKDT